MGTDGKIDEALEHLKKVTGLSLALAPDFEGNKEEAAGKLAQLASAYRDRYDRAAFLRSLLGGTISGQELYTAASRFHISDGVKRVLYVIECPAGKTEIAERVVRQMFVSGSSDMFIVLENGRMVLIRSAGRKDSASERRQTAHTIVDMLNTEALVSAYVGYTNPVENLKELPSAFRSAELALAIGRIFSTDEYVFEYSRLGVGRLIYDLPEDTCRMFLRELFGSGDPIEFDQETASIINALFENNLNISEAARELYVHRNTLVYRIEKIRQATGIDLRSFDDAVSLKIAMMISKKLKSGGA